MTEVGIGILVLMVILLIAARILEGLDGGAET